MNFAFVWFFQFRLHYTWIDIGTPSVSFLVALDSGSDLLWIPCNCVQCAPLTPSYYSSLVCDIKTISTLLLIYVVKMMTSLALISD